MMVLTCFWRVLVLATLVQSLPIESDIVVAGVPIPILEQHHVSEVDGSYKFGFETGNGITVQNSGFIKPIKVAKYNEAGEVDGETEAEAFVQIGSYSYPSPDGRIITVSYIADENGFQPMGEHLPTPPTIPDAIQIELGKIANQPVGQAKVNKLVNGEIDQMMVSSENAKIDDLFVRFDID